MHTDRDWRYPPCYPRTCGLNIVYLPATFRDHAFFSGVQWDALLEQEPPELLPESESERVSEEWQFTSD